MAQTQAEKEKGKWVSFDDFPADHKEMHTKRRSISSVANPEEEEQ